LDFESCIRFVLFFLSVGFKIWWEISRTIFQQATMTVYLTEPSNCILYKLSLDKRIKIEIRNVGEKYLHRPF